MCLSLIRYKEVFIIIVVKKKKKFVFVYIKKKEVGQNGVSIVIYLCFQHL